MSFDFRVPLFASGYLHFVPVPLRSGWQQNAATPCAIGDRHRSQPCGPRMAKHTGLPPSDL